MQLISYAIRIEENGEMKTLFPFEVTKAAALKRAKTSPYRAVVVRDIDWSEGEARAVSEIVYDSAQWSE